MTFSQRFIKALGNLVLAILNATLMLLIILGVVVFLLLGRIGDLAGATKDTVQQALLPQAERLDALVAKANSVETAITNCDAPATIQADLQSLREDVGQLRHGIDKLQTVEPQAVAESILQALAARIFPPES